MRKMSSDRQNQGSNPSLTCVPALKSQEASHLLWKTPWALAVTAVVVGCGRRVPWVSAPASSKSLAASARK